MHPFCKQPPLQPAPEASRTCKFSQLLTLMLPLLHLLLLLLLVLLLLPALAPLALQPRRVLP